MRTVLKTALYAVALLVGRIAGRTDGAVVLMYHSVSRNDWRWSVDPEVFKRQIAHLAKHRTVVPLANVVAYARGEKTLPRNAVALTFDDGYKDTLTEVLPILKEYNLSATLFLTSDLGQKETLHNLPRPTWDDVRALHASGLFSIQVHGRTHASLISLAPDSLELREELIGCADDIEREIGVRPTVVAYPYGNKTLDIADAVRNMGFEAAFGTREGVVEQGVHPYVFPRVSVERIMSQSLSFLRAEACAVRIVAALRSHLRS